MALRITLSTSVVAVFARNDVHLAVDEVGELEHYLFGNVAWVLHERLELVRIKTFGKVFLECVEIVFDEVH